MRCSNQIQGVAKRPAGRQTGPVTICVLACLLCLTGCSLLLPSSSPPKASVKSFQLTTNPPTGPVVMEVLQLQIMRQADAYASTVAQACDEIGARTTNSDLRLAALQWKLGQATSAFIDATGQNPAVNALDMLVLVSIARMVVEDYGVATYGDAITPLLEAQCKMETNAWAMARAVLRPSQEQELRDLIQEWRRKNPHQRYVGMIRFQEFVTAMGRMPAPSATAPTSIFSLLYLDPLAGLDPTAAAIEETRQLGERAMFYSQRMPLLLSWQVQVLTYQIATQPESKQVLSTADRLAASAEVFAKTAQQLPQVVNDQREAAIRQILDGLASQDLQVRQTLNAGGAAAASINAAIQSLTEFVRYVSPTNASPSATASNSPPFNILDYGTAASQVGSAAKDLNALLVSVNQTTPQLAQLGRQTTADAERVVNRAFRLGLVLILVLLAGSVGAGLTYRVLVNKLTRDGNQPSEPKP